MSNKLTNSSTCKSSKSDQLAPRHEVICPKGLAARREAVSLYLEIRVSNPDTLEKVVDRDILGC